MSNFLQFSVNRSRWGVPPFRSHLQLSHLPCFQLSSGCPGSLPGGKVGCPRHICGATCPPAKKAAGLGEFCGTWCAARIWWLYCSFVITKPKILDVFLTDRNLKYHNFTVKSHYNWCIHDCGRWRYELIWRFQQVKKASEIGHIVIRIICDCHVPVMCHHLLTAMTCSSAYSLTLCLESAKTFDTQASS